MRLVRFLSVVGALAVPAAAVAALELPHIFQSGQTLSASQLNENFAAVASEVDALRADLEQIEGLQGQVASLQSELNDANQALGVLQGAAGYADMGDGPVPFYRKVLVGAKTDTTMTLPHGLTNPVGKVVGCSVSNVGPSEQAFAVGIQVGAGAVAWCDVDASNVEVEFLTDTPRDTIYVVLDYVL